MTKTLKTLTFVQTRLIAFLTAILLFVPCYAQNHLETADHAEAQRERLAITAFITDTNRRAEFVERATILVNTFPEVAPELGLRVMRHVQRGAPEMEALAAVLIEKVGPYSPNHARQIAHHIASQYMIRYMDPAVVDPWLSRYLAWGGDPEGESQQMIRTVKLATGEFQCDNYGRQMPDITLRDLEGNEVSISEFRGKFVFIDFWASWCGPCRAAIPHVRAAYQEFKNAPIVFLSISMDRNDEAWKQAALGPFQAPWLHLTANGTSLGREWGVRAVPRKIVLDPDGRLVADHIRGTTLNTQLTRLAERHGWEL